VRRNTLISQLVSFAISLLILIAGAVGFFFLVHKPESQARATAQSVPRLHTEPVRPHDGGFDMVVDGIVAPFREIQVAAEIAGKIVFKSEACNGGQFVTKDTPLIQIDPRDYELEVRRLTNQLEQADASLEELSVEISNTKELILLVREQVALETKEVQRLEGLVNERVVTDSALDRAKQVELTARNSLVQSKNQSQLLTTRRRRLESAKQLVTTELERAQLDLQRTEIVAAVDGVVVNDLVEQDSYVQRGTPLFTLEDTSAVEVKCRLKMDELHWLWRQSAATSAPVANDAGANYQIPHTPVTVGYHLAGRDNVRFDWKGVLARYDGIGLDEATRTVPCRVVVANPRDVTVVCEDAKNCAAPPALVRGMFVTVTIHVEQPGPLVLVPERAVQPGKSVWVVRDGQLAAVKSLDLIERVVQTDEHGNRETFWLIESSASQLTQEDRVVVPPFGTLTAGLAVEEADGP
jgi:multidrug efflux pump subunit AcrA (membrane-fusion protein)